MVSLVEGTYFFTFSERQPSAISIVQNAFCEFLEQSWPELKFLLLYLSPTLFHYQKSNPTFTVLTLKSFYTASLLSIAPHQMPLFVYQFSAIITDYIYILPKFLDYCTRVVGKTVRVKGPKSLLENCLPEMSESLHPWGLIIIATWTRPEQW